jgi:hypothetical protein
MSGGVGRQHLLLRHRQAVQKRLHRRLAEAPAPLVRSLLVVPSHPLVEVRLQLFDRRVELPAKRHPVELVEHRLVEPRADPVRLRALRLGPRVIDVLDREVQAAPRTGSTWDAQGRGPDLPADVRFLVALRLLQRRDLRLGENPPLLRDLRLQEREGTRACPSAGPRRPP